MVYDYFSLSHKFYFLKTYFFPHENEKIDLKEDPIKLTLVFSQMITSIEDFWIDMTDE